MDANQGDAYTAKAPMRSRNGAEPGWAAMYEVTFSGLTGRCGNTEPGIAATASRKSSTSAVRMLVSCRHELSSSATTGFRPRGGGAAAGAGRSSTAVTATSPRRS